MKNKSVVIISLLALVGIFVGALSFYNSNETAKLDKLTHTQAPFIRPHSTTFGENKKNIMVVEFLDPECEACGYFHKAVKEVYKEYYEDIQLVIRYLDNHGNSKFAVKLLEASKEQNKYTQVMDVIFETQGKWAQHNNEKPELLWELLTSVEGLDIAKLRKDVEEINVDNMLSTDRMDAGTLGVRGTPTFFVNGKKLDKLSYQGLLDLIESEIYK